MTISLGRRLPVGSSDLPGSRNGSGQSAVDPPVDCSTNWPALLPYLVLLPVGFAEPGRSPGLLVSSYLAVSPLPATTPRRDDAGGLFSVALSLLESTSGGRYPPPRPAESGLSSLACPRPHVAMKTSATAVIPST